MVYTSSKETEKRPHVPSWVSTHSEIIYVEPLEVILTRCIQLVPHSTCQCSIKGITLGKSSFIIQAHLMEVYFLGVQTCNPFLAWRKKLGLVYSMSFIRHTYQFITHPPFYWPCGLNPPMFCCFLGARLKWALEPPSRWILLTVLSTPTAILVSHQCTKAVAT